MSEENGLIYCPQCGGANPDTFKFCSHCGAKLEQSMSGAGVFSKPEEIPAAQPAYERVDAEVISEGQVPPTQDEININYAQETQGSFEENTMSGDFSDGNTEYNSQYYYTENASSGTGTAAGKKGNGNVGFAIASMICGILSILCCCLSWFSLVLAIIAIVMGVISLNGKYDGKGMAIAGLITGGLGIFLFLIIIITMGSGALLSSFTKELMDL